MGAQRTSFEKLQRDRAKKAKAAAKREQRQNKDAEPATAVLEDDGTAPLAGDDHDGELSATELLERIEAIHRRFDAKQMTFEEFEEEKAELLRRLPID
jgi:hypothetical protein